MTWWLQRSRSSHLECPRVSCNPERWQRPLALGPWGPVPHQVFMQPTPFRFLTHHEGPPGHTYESLLWSTCPNSVHTFCHPLPLAFLCPWNHGEGPGGIGPMF